MSRIVVGIIIIICFLITSIPILLIPIESDDTERKQEDEEQVEYLKRWKGGKKDE